MESVELRALLDDAQLFPEDGLEPSSAFSLQFPLRGLGLGAHAPAQSPPPILASRSAVGCFSAYAGGLRWSSLPELGFLKLQIW